LAEEMESSAKVALQRIGELIFLHSIDTTGKIFIFNIFNEPYNAFCIGKFQLEVLKGSVYTFIWSTFARFDDEYVLYHIIGEVKHLLWRVKGVDAVNAKISGAEVDWFQIRSVLNMMRIRSIGVLAFSKLLGRLLLSLPYYYKNRQYVAPMPVTFMY